MRFHSLVTSLAFWKLLTFLCTEAMYPSNSFNPMFLRAIHIQVMATFLLFLDSDNYRPNNSSGISFYINPQIPSHPTIHMIFFSCSTAKVFMIYAKSMFGFYRQGY